MLHDLTIPMVPNQQNVNCYYAEEITETTIVADGFIGSVSQGGSVNYRQLKLTPHGNGTHTECYGHISDDPEAVLTKCYTTFIHTALLITVTPSQIENGDWVIRLDDLSGQVRNKLNGIDALIIRTLPNDNSKLTKQYSGTNPPYPEPGIGAWLVEQGISHWLIDLPSVDKEVDGGALNNHKGFWQVQDGQYKNVAADHRKHCTITELIYVPDLVADGVYQLYLMPMAVAAEAAVSRVLVG